MPRTVLATLLFVLLAGGQARALVLTGTIAEVVEGASFVLEAADGSRHLVRLSDLPDVIEPEKRRLKAEEAIRLYGLLPSNRFECVVRQVVARKVNYCECFLQYLSRGNSHDLAESVARYMDADDISAARREIPVLTLEEILADGVRSQYAEELVRKAGM